MPFGRGNKTQRSHTAAIQRINAARVARRVSAATRVSAAGRISAKSKATQAKAPQAPQIVNVLKDNVQNQREPPPDRGTLRENQDQIAISLINNKLDTLLELLNVNDPNTNIIMTSDQLNVRLDNLIKSLKEKQNAKERQRSAERRERDRTEQAYRIHQNIRHGAYD